MSSKGKPLAVHLPSDVLLKVAVCACYLTPHLTFKGLAPVDGQTGFDLAAQAGPAHPACEFCKEDLVFSPDTLQVEVFPPNRSHRHRPVLFIR
jgi:hypothetical protein